MPYTPEFSYDPVEKIWISKEKADHFPADLSIGEIIFNELQRKPTQIAQISATEGTVLSRKDLLLNSMRIASYLRKLGLLQSDIVGIVGRNTTHMSAVAYACLFNGLAFHTLSVSYDKNKFENMFNITKPKIIFCDGDEYERVAKATMENGVRIISMRNHPLGSTTILDVLQTAVEDNFKPARLEQGNDQTLAILCSSGTTGTPKAVTITHSRKILNSLLMLTEADVQYAHSTIDWLTCVMTLISSAVFGTLRIIADNTFEAAFVLRLIEVHKITWILLPPAYLTQLVNSAEFKTANLSSLQYCMLTGGRCSLEVKYSFRKRFTKDILHFAYGMTEAGTWMAVNWNFDEKPKSVGRLTTGFKVKILDEQNIALGPNQTGEVCLNNQQYWTGYFANPAETQNILDSQGWLHSGDLGYMDDDGFLFLEERKKDLLKYQGMQYYPYEIEEVIAQMPQVAEVCVFGFWNELNGDEAAAVVVKKANTQLNPNDVVNYVQLNVTEKYKHLNAGVIIVDELKRTVNGKTNRIANKAYFLEKIRLNEH